MYYSVIFSPLAQFEPATFLLEPLCGLYFISRCGKSKRYFRLYQRIPRIPPLFLTFHSSVPASNAFKASFTDVERDMISVK